jgi:hypothetical protein
MWKQAQNSIKSEQKIPVEKINNAMNEKLDAEMDFFAVSFFGRFFLEIFS